MFKEFKEFAVRGNVVDLAVGVIIGAAFGKIVTSFVDDVVMPPIGMLLARVDFENMFLPLRDGNFETLAAARAAGVPVIAYGAFITNMFEFVIVAMVIFLFVRQINRLRREPEKSSPSTKKCPFCISAVDAAATKCPNCTSVLANAP